MILLNLLLEEQVGAVMLSFKLSPLSHVFHINILKPFHITLLF